jgi:thiol:disulfide interchange protein DsbC
MPKLSFTFLFLAALAMLSTRPASGANLDLGTALKIGTGKTMVIEFTDPDCPFCRRGAAFFKGRTDVTRYIFFNPLPMHPHAREKAAFILSSPDPAGSYEEVLSGKLDKTGIPAPSAAGTRLLEVQMATAREEGFGSTPTYIICGRIIHGFDQQKIEQLLDK